MHTYGGRQCVLLDYFPAAIESLRNCLRSFSISSDALRARAPAALFPFSTCACASFAKASKLAVICSTRAFIGDFV